MKPSANESLDAKGLRTFKRKTISISSGKLIRTGYLLPGKHIPLLIEPELQGLNLVAWAGSNRDLVISLLLKHRALLFRGFEMNAPHHFNEFVKTASNGELLEYRDRSSPRHEVGEKIYTSTDYPADQQIALHNEGTYWLTWPLKIFFSCFIAPDQGGATPIADCRNVFKRISPSIRQQLIDKKIMYIRNYNDGFGLTWQTVFQTDQKAIVEKYCLSNLIEFEWKNGDRLRTKAIRPAIAEHPQTGEVVWFNHAAFFHVTSLEPTIQETLRREFKEEDLPYNTYYGDGSLIEDDVIGNLREAYQEEKVSFPWKQYDVLMLDNMSVSHGREPYKGERRVLVGMAEPYSLTRRS